MSSFGPRGYSPDHELLICQRRELDRYVDAVRGSQLVLGDCGHQVTCSPSGIARQIQNPDVRTICTSCYATDPRLDREDVEVRRLPGALEELREALPDDQAFVDHVERAFKEL